MNNINVFTGPMKSGKSSAIIREAKSLMNAGEKVQVFKPTIDDRFSINEVKDRGGNSIKAINIKKIDEIQNYDADIFVIDEFQFLDGDLNVIKDLAEKGKKFYIAGLNLTAEKKVFGKMGDLIKCSDNVKMLTANCDCCGKNNAIYTFYAAEKTGDILVGEANYKPLCPKCYDRLSEDKNNQF